MTEVLFGVTDSDAMASVDFVTTTPLKTIQFHDSFIREGTRPHSILRSRQLLGGSWCSCVLVSFSSERWPEMHGNRPASHVSINFREGHPPLAFWDEMDRRAKEPTIPYEELRRRLRWKR